MHTPVPLSHTITFLLSINDLSLSVILVFPFQVKSKSNGKRRKRRGDATDPSSQKLHSQYRQYRSDECERVKIRYCATTERLSKIGRSIDRITLCKELLCHIFRIIIYEIL
jgi:hypothetical protein